MIALLSDPERNATRAFRAAGFKGTDGAARVGAHQLMKDPRVQALIAQHETDVLERVRERAGVSLERTLHSIARSAFADPAALFHENGTMKMPHELDEDIRQAIEGIEIVEIGEGPQKVRKVKYKLAPRSAHRDMLMKHLNGYKAHEAAKGEGLASGLGALLSQMRSSAIPVVQEVPFDEAL